MMPMNKNLFFLFTSMAPICFFATERFQAYADACYLRFYSSNDASKVSQEQNNSGINIRFHGQEFEPTWGLVAGFSYDSPFADLQMKLSGFLFKNSTRYRSHYYPGITLDSGGDFSNVSSIYSNFNAALYPTYYGFNLSIAPPSEVVGVGIAIDENNQLNFNQIDLTFAPRFSFNKVFDLLPFAGFSGLFSYFNNSSVTYIQDSAGIVENYLAIPFKNTLNNQFKGFGPNVGLAFKVNITQFLDFDILGSCRFMWGQKQAYLKSQFDVAEVVAYTPTATPTYAKLSQNRHAVQSDYTFYAGLNAKIPVKQSMQFGLTLGYRFEYLPNFYTAINRYEFYQDSLNNYGKSAQTMDGIDLSMQGLTAGAFINF